MNVHNLVSFLNDHDIIGMKHLVFLDEIFNLSLHREELGFTEDQVSDIYE